MSKEKETKQPSNYKDLPNDLKEKVKDFTSLQSNFAFYRAQGFSQPDSAKKAGSKAKKTEDLRKIGYTIESKVDGIKDYIAFLKTQHAIKNLVSEDEVIDMLRHNYRDAVARGNIAAANKAAELLGNTLGMFNLKDKNKDQQESNSNTKKTKNNISVFKDGLEDTEDKSNQFKKLKSMLEGVEP